MIGAPYQALLKLLSASFRRSSVASDRIGCDGSRDFQRFASGSQAQTKNFHSTGPFGAAGRRRFCRS